MIDPMKFKKTLIIGIDESALSGESWKTIDSLTEERVHILKESPDMINQLKDTDCLLVNFGIDVTKEHINSAQDLKYIGILAVAHHRIDSIYAKQKNIAVSNIAGYCTNSVAEFIIASILESLRNLEEGKKRGKNKEYSEAGMSAGEIKGKTFAIFGLGAIGKRRTAEIAKGFGAQVKYWSRTRKEDYESKGINYVEPDKLIEEADFISLNLAQTPETENFLNKDRIEKIKSNAVVINTSPMELVDLEALESRLKKGDITFILDHSDEMSKEDLDKLSAYENCIIYPPIAYISDEAKINRQNLFIDNMKNFLNGTPTNLVN